MLGFWIIISSSPTSHWNYARITALHYIQHNNRPIAHSIACIPDARGGWSSSTPSYNLKDFLASDNTLQERNSKGYVFLMRCSRDLQRNGKTMKEKSETKGNQMKWHKGKYFCLCQGFISKRRSLQEWSFQHGFGWDHKEYNLLKQFAIVALPSWYGIYINVSVMRPMTIDMLNCLRIGFFVRIYKITLTNTEIIKYWKK